MKLPRIAAHLLALAAGCGFGSLFLTRKTPAAMESPRMETRAPSKSAAPRIHSRELLAALASVPMSATERTSLKYDIYAQWAHSDAEGLLSHLQGKAWPANMGDGAFSVLADNDPQALLRYIRENGCPDPLIGLAYEKDPRSTLTLLLGEGSHSYPDRIFEILFERGEELDPDFHQRIPELPDERAKKAAFDKVSVVMIKGKRYDEYFEFLGEYGAHGSSESIASSFAEIVLNDHERLGQLDAIPESSRHAAVKSVIEELSNGANNVQATKDLLPLLAEKGLLEEHHEEVLEAIMGRASPDDAVPKAAQESSWKDWALGLPEGERWDLLREAAIARWAGKDLENIANLGTLPTAQLQDAARIGAVIGLMEQERMNDAKRMVATIGDPMRREKFIQVLERMDAGEEVENFDPFATEAE